MQYIMPNVECKRCTLQWYYQTGNSSIAYPVEFWNCADIQVTTGALSLTPKAFEASALSVARRLAAAAATYIWEQAADLGGPFEQQLYDQTLGGCGISGTENGRKCFSIDVRVTDQWCDKVRCIPEFTWEGNGRNFFTWDGNGRAGDGHMCMWVGVDNNCAPLRIPPEVSLSARWRWLTLATTLAKKYRANK
jgi:hypothetical protein